jgi:hypothetical protein
MAQLAREGRLKPEAVEELIRAGKLDKGTIAQLRAARTYPEKYLRAYSGVKTVASTRMKSKTVITTVRWLRYTFEA